MTNYLATINTFNKYFVLAFFVVTVLFVFGYVSEVNALGNCPAPLCVDNVNPTPTTNSATITWTTNIPATSTIEYWLNVRSPRTINASPSPTTNHTVMIPDLIPGFIYGFKITINASGLPSSTFTSQFTTLSSACTDPVCISGVSVDSTTITQTSAVVTWTTNVPANSQVEYGPTTRYGNATPLSSSLTTSHRVPITTGLNPGFIYNFRAISVAAGFPARSSNGQFTTLSPACTDTGPVCINRSSVTVSSITQTSAVVTWTTNVPANSQVKYNTRPTFTTGETRSTPVDSNLVTSHRVTISDLNSGTIYYVQAVSSDGTNTARSPAVQFTTSGTIDPPIPGGTTQTIGWGFDNPFAGNPQNVFEAVFRIVNWLANIAGSLVVIMIIYGGVKFLISRGNPGEVTKAKTILWWALAGMAVVLIGKGFVFIVDSILRNQIPIP
ncbi:MAG: fibronectin type III domain-containing protein [Candidatus Taylorbacteria bacterium]|nr:fibronectin type III domain-containing protein [Candidatus Taylorbacteria bacterium]